MITDKPLPISRRNLMLAMGAGSLAACVPLDRTVPGRLAAKLRIIEATYDGMLGVAFRDTATGQMLGYRANELFPHCSSFKLSLAALVLKLDQDGEISADERLQWTKADLLSYAPFTAERLEQGATLRELAEAAQKLSDNTAANLLLARVGGPQRMTQFWRSMGDMVSRLDRTEPELNFAPAGEVRDTTSPHAMALTVEKILFGDVLTSANQLLLRKWMTATGTGARRIRAGLPQNWNAGDKTGTSTGPGSASTYADIGFAGPVDSAPFTFAAYYRSSAPQPAIDPQSESVLAQVGHVLVSFAAQQTGATG